MSIDLTKLNNKNEVLQKGLSKKTIDKYKEKFKFPLQLVIIGRTLSGKSFLLRKRILPAIWKEYEAIYIISPTAKLDVGYQEFIKTLPKKKQDNIYLIDEFSEQSIQTLIGLIGENKKMGSKDKYLIILDDITDLLNQSNHSFFTQLAIKSRHYNISYVITSHKYRALNRLIRNNARIKIFFRINSPPEFKSVVEELISQDADQKIIEQMINDSTGDFKAFVVEHGANTDIHSVILAEGELMDW